MKKITKFIAGFSAAAALLLGVGCTNQADYVEDNTARNACSIEGLYVEGLDTAYNGSEFEFHAVVVNEKGELKAITEASDGKVTDDTLTLLSGKVADSYEKDGKKVGYKAGTIYKASAADKKLFDGDSMAVAYQRAQMAAGKTGTDIKTFAAGTLEFYLKVGNDYLFGTKKNSAGNEVPLTQKLSLPTSPAGTSNAALQSRWVKVVIANGVPTVTLEKKVDEPVNVTLACISLDLLPKTEADIEALAGVEIKKTAKAGTNQKFTVTITGLESNNGIDVVFGGADISDTDTGSFGDNWYDESTHKKTITDGKVSFEFYGKSVNGGNLSGWGRTYTAAEAGPEIVIASVNDKKQDGPRLLTSPKGRSGNDSKDCNFMFPGYCIGDFDVELTIDRSKIDSTSVTQADPVVAASEIYIDAIKVTNCPAIGAAGYLGYCAAWLSKGDWSGPSWGSNTPYKLSDSEYYATDGSSYLIVSEVYKPNKKTFQLDMQVVNPATDDTFLDTKIVTNSIKTPVLQTEDYATKHWILVCERASKTAADIYNMWLEPVDKDINYKAMYDYTNATLVENVVDNFAVKGWWSDSWTDENTTLTKIDAFNWKWTVTTTTAMPSYKFSIIKAIGDWDHGRYELANTYTLTADGTSIGPMNYNNEPDTRATIDLAASSTYTFTITNTKKGMFIKVVKN